jgi:hypothetical protein
VPLLELNETTHDRARPKRDATDRAKDDEEAEEKSAPSA